MSAHVWRVEGGPAWGPPNFLTQARFKDEIDAMFATHAQAVVDARARIAEVMLDLTPFEHWMHLRVEEGIDSSFTENHYVTTVVDRWWCVLPVDHPARRTPSVRTD